MEQQNFFTAPQPMQPLAARLRPQSLEEFVGQRHLLAPGKVLWRLIEGDHISSMIFWGPPGVGKTTLARIIANRTKAKFIDFSAVIIDGGFPAWVRPVSGGEWPGSAQRRPHPRRPHRHGDRW